MSAGRTTLPPHRSFSFQSLPNNPVPSSTSPLSKVLSTGSQIINQSRNYIFSITAGAPNKERRSFTQIDCNDRKQLENFLESRLNELLIHVQKNHPNLKNLRKKLVRLRKLVFPLICKFKLSPYTYSKSVLEFSRKLNDNYQQKTKAHLVDFFSELRKKPDVVKQWLLKEDIEDPQCKKWYELILSSETVNSLCKDIEKNETFIEARAEREKTYSLTRRAFRSVNWEQVFVVGLVVCIVCGLFFVAAGQPTPPENVGKEPQNRRRNLAPDAPEFRIDASGTNAQTSFVASSGTGRGAAVWSALLSGDTTLTAQARILSANGPEGSQLTFRNDDLYDFTTNSVKCRGDTCVFTGIQPDKSLEGRVIDLNTTQVTTLPLVGMNEYNPSILFRTDGSKVVVHDSGGFSAKLSLQGFDPSNAPYPANPVEVDPITGTANQKGFLTEVTSSTDILVGLETNEGGNWDVKIQRGSFTSSGLTKVGGRYSASGGSTTGDQRNLRMAQLPYPNQHFNVYDGDGPDGSGLYFTRMDGTTTLAGPTRFDSLSGTALSGDIACDPWDMCALTWQEGGSIWTKSIYHTSSTLRLGITPTLVNDPGFMTGNTNPHVTYFGPDRSFMYNYLRGGGVYGRVLRDARVVPTITANTLRLPFSIPYGNNTFARLNPAFYLNATHPLYGPTELFYQFPFITGLAFNNELNQTIPIFSQAQFDAGNITLSGTSCNGTRLYTVQVCMPDYLCSNPVMPTAYLPLSFFYARQFNLSTCTMPEFQRTILAEPFQYGTFEALGSLPSDLGVQYYIGNSSYWLKSRNETAIQLANRALSPIYRFYQADQTATNFKLYYDEADKPSNNYLLLKRTPG